MDNNFAINDLANKEFMLYGGRSGMNMNCPSFYNGYVGSMNNYGMNYYNPAFLRYGNNNQDIFTTAQQNSSGTSNISNYTSDQLRALSADLNTLGDYYVKNSAPSESLTGAAIGGGLFGIINNTRLLLHPYNSYKALSPTAKMFTDIGKENSKLRGLWLNMETNGVVREAYGQMHKLNGAMHSRWPMPLFKAKLEGKSLKDAERILKEMQGALSSGNTQRIAELSEEARRITKVKTGWIPRGWNAIGLNKPFEWIKDSLKNTDIGKLFGIGEAKSTVAQAAAKSVSEKAAASTLGGSLAHSCGLGNGLLFAALEFVSDFVFEGKIQAAFEKNKETGYKQLRQTAIKGIGSAVGWAVGEGIGAWAGAWAAMKVGAIAGSTVAPGVGTAIGAVAGLIGGSIGCWLTGKVTHHFIGQEAGTLAKVEKMKQTKQGQKELLQLTVQQAQDDKHADARTIQSIKNVAGFYGVDVA